LQSSLYAIAEWSRREEDHRFGPKCAGSPRKRQRNRKNRRKYEEWWKFWTGIYTELL